LPAYHLASSKQAGKDKEVAHSKRPWHEVGGHDTVCAGPPVDPFDSCAVALPHRPSSHRFFSLSCLLRAQAVELTTNPHCFFWYLAAVLYFFWSSGRS
jgi:hypothetical protein